MVFNNIEFTEETLLKADKYFADLNQKCIDATLNGDFEVNCPGEYIKRNEINRDKSLAGLSRESFTYAQRAMFIQTGKEIPLFY